MAPVLKGKRKATAKSYVNPQRAVISASLKALGLPATGKGFASLGEEIGLKGHTIYTAYLGHKNLGAAAVTALQQIANATTRVAEWPVRAKQTQDRVHPVRAAREAAAMSIKQLASITGYKAGVLQALEAGRPVLSERMADKICTALPALDRELMLRNDEHPPTIGVEVAALGTKPAIATPQGMTARYVPLISWAQAGDLTNFEDIYEHEGHIAFDVKDPKAFSITIRGDSMEPRFSAGDVAIVYPSQEARNGDLVIGRTVDGDVFFKRLTVVSPTVYRLSSYNAAYPPFDRKPTELAWLYKVASITVHNL